MLIVIAVTTLLFLTLPSVAYSSEAMNDMNSLMQNDKNVEAATTEEEEVMSGDYGRVDPSPVSTRSRATAGPILHAQHGRLFKCLPPCNRRG